MKNFEFTLSTRIYFGTHIIEETLQKEKKYFAGNVLIVTTGGSLITHGYLPDLVSMIGHLPDNKKVVVYDKVTQNPKLEEVLEAVSLGIKEGVNTVVGFGGGSSIDAAKAAAVGIGSAGNDFVGKGSAGNDPDTDAAAKNLMSCLLDGKEPAGRVLPIIAIPTTAGTGSELSKGAIISSPAHHIKAGIRGEKLLPAAAIVDTAYTWTVPGHITMETGFDVLAHAIESYASVKANVFSEMLSEKAVRIAAHALPLLFHEPDHHGARDKMCFASMLMGMNLANVGTCLPHRMQYAIGACTESSHASGLIALYPAWIGHEFEVNPEKVQQVFQWLGYPAVTDPSQATQRFKEMLDDWKLPCTLSELGITSASIDQLAEGVTGNLANDLLSKKENMVKTIFRESFYNFL